MQSTGSVRRSDFLSSNLPAERPPETEELRGDDDGWLFVGTENDSPDSNAREPVTRSLSSPGERDGVRMELSQFLKRLQDLQLDGDPLIHFPADYEGLVQRLIVENRAGYMSLRDWTGPRRYQDLPVAQLDSEENNEGTTIDGLRVIDQLDAVLRDKQIDAYIVERETYPEKARFDAKSRTEKRQRALERTLKHERDRIQRLSQLRRAMNFDQTEPEAPMPTQRSSSEHRAQVVHRLMAESDEDLAQNPFDCDLRLPILDDLPTFLSDTASSIGEITSQSLMISSSQEGQKEGSASKQTSLYQSLRPDYLHQQRHAKELQQRLDQIDRDLQKLKTSALDETTASADDMGQLIAETRDDLLNNAIELVDFAERNVMELVTSHFV